MGVAAPGLPDNPGFFVPGHSGAFQPVPVAQIQSLLRRPGLALRFWTVMAGVWCTGCGPVQTTAMLWA